MSKCIAALSAWTRKSLICYNCFIQCLILLCSECVVCRNSVLANQNKGFKEQMKTLIDKGRHDDELIEALMVVTMIVTNTVLTQCFFLCQCLYKFINKCYLHVLLNIIYQKKKSSQFHYIYFAHRLTFSNSHKQDSCNWGY